VVAAKLLACCSRCLRDLVGGSIGIAGLDLVCSCSEALLAFCRHCWKGLVGGSSGALLAFCSHCWKGLTGDSSGVVGVLQVL